MKWIQKAGVVRNFENKNKEENDESKDDESAKRYELSDRISSIRKMPSGTVIEKKNKDHAIFKLQLELEKDGNLEDLNNLKLITEQEDEEDR